MQEAEQKEEKDLDALLAELDMVPSSKAPAELANVPADTPADAPVKPEADAAQDGKGKKKKGKKKGKQACPPDAHKSVKHLFASCLCQVYRMFHKVSIMCCCSLVCRQQLQRMKKTLMHCWRRWIWHLAVKRLKGYRQQLQQGMPPLKETLQVLLSQRQRAMALQRALPMAR